MTETNFAKMLNRVFRRNAIEKTFQEQDAAGEPKQVDTQRVRDIQGQEHTEELTQALVEQLTVIDRDKAQLMELMTEELRNRIGRNDITLIILGSAATGGKAIRDIINGPKSSDNEIDYALLTDGEIDTQLAQEIHNIVDEIIKPAADHLGLDDPESYRACGFHNAVHERYSNVESPEALAEEVVSAIEESKPLVEQGLLDYSEMLDELSQKIVIYLGPSSPPETNQRNMQQVLSALKLVADYDRSFFQIIRKTILHEWKKVHRIKEKHVTAKREWTDDRTRDFVKNIGDISSEVKGKSLEKILDQI